MAEATRKALVAQRDRQVELLGTALARCARKREVGGVEEVWRRGSVVVSREGDGVMGYVGMEWRVG